MTALDVTRFVVSILVVAGAADAAQQPVAAPEPVRAGTPEAPVPSLIWYPAPPTGGLWFGFGETVLVTLDVLVGRTGLVEEVLVLGGEPPRRMVLLDPMPWVKQWRFAPPRVDGVGAAVVVPVTIRLEPARPSFFPERLDPAVDTTVPADFALVYRFGTCEFDTRAGTIRQPPYARSIDIQVSADDLRAIHTELLRVDFFAYPPSIGPERLPVGGAEPQILIDHRAAELAVTVRYGLDGYAIATPPTYSVAVLRQGTWTRVVWSGHAAGNQYVLRQAAGVNAVRALLDEIVRRTDISGWGCTVSP